MKTLLIIGTTILLLVQEKVSAQEHLIRKKLLNADSVVLTSHVGLPQLIGKNEDPNDRKLILNGAVNSKFIKERKKLKDSEIVQLADIITMPFLDSIIENGMCFDPHHTIYVFNKKHISFIDICFSCDEFVTSKDIKFSEDDFDQITWKRLEEFFKTKNFKAGFNESKD